jgi:Fuc2NAc and GlcNAc transferase
MSFSLWLAPSMGFLLSWCSVSLLLRHPQLLPVDRPNSRSSHAVPTLRGGGVGIVLGFSAASLALWAGGEVQGLMVLAVVGGGLAVAGVGFWDDLVQLPIVWRLLVHAAAVAWGLRWVGVEGVASLGLAVLLVWMINLYNFMDGIDALAGGQAVLSATSAAWILWLQGETGFAVWLLSLAASAVGFLCFNLPPAKIFLGDVGSGFLGFVFGMLALLSCQSGAMTALSWAILLAVFVTDTGFTLFRRIVAGKPFWQAHRTHAYQRLARRFGHGPVTAGVAAIDAFWLLPLGILAARYPEAGIGLTALAYAPLLWMVWRVRAGEEDINS